MGRSSSQNRGNSAFKVLASEPTGKRPLKKPRRRWEDNIRIDLKEIDVNKRYWVDSALGKGLLESPS